MIKRWLHLENDPDIVVSDNILSAEEVEEAVDCSTIGDQHGEENVHDG